MSTTRSPLDVESLVVMRALASERPLTTEEAYIATAAIRSMASAITNTRFEFELDALRAEVGSQFAASRAELAAFRTAVDARFDVQYPRQQSGFEADRAPMRMMMWVTVIAFGLLTANCVALAIRLFDLRFSVPGP